MLHAVMRMSHVSSVPHLPSLLLVYPVLLLPLVPSDANRGDVLLGPLLDPEQPALALYDLLLPLADLLLLLALLATGAVALHSREALLNPLSPREDPRLPE